MQSLNSIIYFQFSNLLGTIYRKGNVIFSNDGNSIITPVGNRITIYDLKKYKRKTNQNNFR